MAPACAYTVLTGGYEQLNPQEVARESGLRFICLTDNAELRAAEGWEIRYTQPPLPGDPVRSQRMMKILAHQYLPEFESSLYIDNTVKLLAPPEALFAAAADAELALCPHSFRNALHEEFHAVVEQRLDDAALVAEQRAHYQASAPALLDGPMFWTGMMLRRHHAPQLRAAMALWCAHVMRYSRRDQLSAPMALHLAGLEPRLLPLDNYSSGFHSWPHLNGRLESMRVFAAPETDAGKIAELETRLVSMWQGRLAAEAELAAVSAAHAEMQAALNRPVLAQARDLLKRAGQRLTPRAPG